MKDSEKLQASLTRLAKNPDFIAHLVIVREMREQSLRAMQDASTDRLHQIAGAVTVYNAILDNAACWKALEKHDSK